MLTLVSLLVFVTAVGGLSTYLSVRDKRNGFNFTETMETYEKNAWELTATGTCKISE